MMTGAAVAFCGPIGFVGLMVPHICRKLFGADHRNLFPAVILFGGFFMTACDGLARTLLAPVEMPPKPKMIQDLLAFYMGKNTPQRQEFIIKNLKVENDIIEEEEEEQSEFVPFLISCGASEGAIAPVNR